MPSISRDGRDDAENISEQSVSFAGLPIQVGGREGKCPTIDYNFRLAGSFFFGDAVSCIAHFEVLAREHRELLSTSFHSAKAIRISNRILNYEKRKKKIINTVSVEENCKKCSK